MKLRNLLLIATVLVFPVLGANAAVIMDCEFDTPTFLNPGTVNGAGTALEGIWWTDNQDTGEAFTRNTTVGYDNAPQMHLNIENSSDTSLGSISFVRATVQQELDTGHAIVKVWILGKGQGFQFGGMATAETAWDESKLLLGVFRWFNNNQLGYYENGVPTLIDGAISADGVWGEYTFYINFNAGTYDLDIVEGPLTASVTGIALNSNASYDSLKYLAMYNNYNSGGAQGDDAAYDAILVETITIPQPTANATGAILLEMSDLVTGAPYEIYWSDTDLPDTSPSWNFVEAVIATGTEMTWTDRGDLGAAPPPTGTNVFDSALLQCCS